MAQDMLCVPYITGIGNELQRVISHLHQFVKRRVCLSSGLTSCRLARFTKLDCVCTVDLSYFRVGWRVLKLSREMLNDAILAL
jgi:hypothetical protein